MESEREKEKSQIENNNSKAEETRLVTSSLWYDDIPPNFDFPPDAMGANANTGLAKQQEFTLGGKMFDFTGHIRSDIFNQDKMLLNGIETHVRLLRTMIHLPDGQFRRRKILY